MPKSQQEDLSGTAYDSNKGILRYDSGDVLDFISGLVASWTALVPFFAIAAQSEPRNYRYDAEPSAYWDFYLQYKAWQQIQTQD